MKPRPVRTSHGIVWVYPSSFSPYLMRKVYPERGRKALQLALLMFWVLATQWLRDTSCT